MPSMSIAETSSRLVFRQRADWGARLFGLPFLAVGAYFLYHLLGALYDYGSHGTSTSFFKNLPGTLLLVFMIVAFAVPGILLIFFAKEVALDVKNQEVTETVDFLLYQKRTNHSLNLFTKVIAREERNDTRKNGLTAKTTYTYPVVLATNTAVEVIVTVSTIEEEAEFFALKLSKFISKTYENNMDPETHSPRDQ